MLEKFFTSASGVLVMLRDKYPMIYENEKLLDTYCKRIIDNYGIDIGLLRGVPLGFDCEYTQV